MRVFALVLLCLTAFGQPATTPQNDGQANQQKARTLVTQMITALGGQAYLTLQDSQIEGRTGVFYHGRSEGGGVFRRFWQWPGKERWEFTKQRDIVNLYVGDKAYETTFRGTQALDPNMDDALRRFMLRRHYALEIIVRNWFPDPGTAFFYEGPGLAENHSVERVTIVNSKDETVSLLIDTDSHLPVKKTFITRDPQTRDRDQIDEIYDNWKKIQGVSTPQNTLVSFNGDLYRQYFVTSVTYNSQLTASLFNPGPLNYDRNKQ
jgi:hypothetical protein